jgi:hypothetical protein
MAFSTASVTGATSVVDVNLAPTVPAGSREPDR